MDKSRTGKPLNAFFLFSMDKREAAKKDNPDTKISPKELGSTWKHMTEAQKAPWQKRADKAKAAYAAGH